MKWRDNSTHPDDETECLCEYRHPNPKVEPIYLSLISRGGGWITQSYCSYEREEIPRWCPLDEIAKFLNKDT